MTLTGIAPAPALAEEALDVNVIPSKPGVTQVISRILEDPHRDYSRAHGPDDCDSEETYGSTRDALGQYVANPEDNKAALRDYILSGKSACNCTRAIVGKEIDFLVDDLGMSMSSLPCL
ncbi:MAG TPA: hypothetical protein VET88_16305 [Gammaproteobacteria bacterium]|nr:hypothetical protein [Gammaproteobacteria bacterium]